MKLNLPLVSKQTGILIPIKAPQKHPVTVDYKEVKKVEEFNRALCFTGDSEKTCDDMLCFLC